MEDITFLDSLAFHFDFLSQVFQIVWPRFLDFDINIDQLVVFNVLLAERFVI